MDEIPAPLLRLKILIWVHSALGALLLLGLPAATFLTQHVEFAGAVLPCLAGWTLGCRALRNKAAELAPEDLVPGPGLPLWVPLLVALGAFLSPLWFASPFGPWVAVSWVLLAATIAIQWGISHSLGIPVHRRVWAGMLVSLSIPFAFMLIILLIVWGSWGC